MYVCILCVYVCIMYVMYVYMMFVYVYMCIYVCMYVYLYVYGYVCMGTAVAQWLRCCATNWKVAVSIPDDVIGIFP